MNWQTLAGVRPGYFGKRRDEIEAGYNEQYGDGAWRLAWQVGPIAVPRLAALMLYEDGYQQFLQDQPEIRRQLVEEAADIYDDQPSNVEAGFDYQHQETNVNHLHDIAIRRALLRCGEWFQGKEVIQIRHSLSPHPLSMLLSPGQVPFHRPDLIIQPQLGRYWWEPNSVESFYQSNKVLQVKA